MKAAIFCESANTCFFISVNQKVLMKQLKKIGCTVDVANDGLEALAFLEETHYRKKGGRLLSVILMDLEMPNMDGLVSTLHSYV
jgi:CheY-like chemotaxis protein